MSQQYSVDVSIDIEAADSLPEGFNAQTVANSLREALMAMGLAGVYVEVRVSESNFAFAGDDEDDEDY